MLKGTTPGGIGLKPQPFVGTWRMGSFPVDVSVVNLTQGQWLNGVGTFWDYIFSRENKVQTFFFRVHWLSELITMVIVSPLNGVVGPLTNGLCMAYKWRLLTTY